MLLKREHIMLINRHLYHIELKKVGSSGLSPSVTNYKCALIKIGLMLDMFNSYN